jgi:tRNA(His) 5'-end guanylyltransferase
MQTDSLGDRMKKYEGVTQLDLMGRTPVIIRLDGKSFHTFTKKITPAIDPSLNYGPFSEKLHLIMNQTMRALGCEIQNCKFGYTQSDEISLLLTDWNKLTTDQWFGGNIQKIVSISASIATAYFNHYFAETLNLNYANIKNIALFDSRVFNLPKEEVTNYFIWRQQDTTRNSINMLGQYHFSHSNLHGKNVSQVQDLLMLEKGINWNDLETWKKRGSCFHTNLPLDEDGTVEPIIDEIPIFTQDRDFIEQFVI